MSDKANEIVKREVALLKERVEVGLVVAATDPTRSGVMAEEIARCVERVATAKLAALLLPLPGIDDTIVGTFKDFVEREKVALPICSGCHGLGCVPSLCSTCGGVENPEAGSVCSTCDGRGVLAGNDIECPSCTGGGFVPRCQDCGGGTVSVECPECLSTGVDPAW